ncbi:MAG: hypothetical protein WBO04_06975 [Steroidobacteraceae bacterium]
MLPSGLPEQVQDDEDLARFLTQSSQYSSTGVKANAFMPNPHTQDVSVFRHGAFPLDGLRSLGISATSGRALHGAAIVRARVARDTGLAVDSDEMPPAGPRHALIHGWPQFPGDLQLQKAQHKEIALVLASHAGQMIPLP